MISRRLFISQVFIELGDLSRMTYLVDGLRLNIGLLITLQLFSASLLLQVTLPFCVFTDFFPS
jgi:hypothetical protein